jgi:hypothetical protein
LVTVVSITSQYVAEPFRASIHKELLCYYSEYYTALFKRGSSGTKKDDIRLGLSSDSAHSLVCWLYTGTTILEETHHLLLLYIFAVEKRMLALRRYIMSKIIQDHELEDDSTRSYLGRLPYDCGLFRYLVDLWAIKWIPNSSPDEMEDLGEDKSVPRKFFYHAMKKLAIMVHDQEASMATLKNPCNYHEHVSANEWNRSMLVPCSHSLASSLVLTKTACRFLDPPMKEVTDEPNDDYYHNQ